ncbi:cryptochrome/photolyase family protein [Nocardia alba]|uniref:Deoxyribodipyrimidine photo-lyase n=1 Tax=Nocardia alba TaxID=225051 RepID=A0A4R1FPG2_9NOCA|nr:deoxyribodipyrimidine photo-lyase [Nocardia alba]TCJ97046.1 deoxyribodipyrimidine photo-lyase [Nocardia alba]
MSVAIALFTRDLRVHDNPVLTAAARAADRVVPLFVVDEALVPDRCPPNRAYFLAAALAELDKELRGLGATLVVRRGAVADVVDAVIEETGATSVHLAEDVSRYSRQREQALRRNPDTVVHLHSGSVTATSAELVPSTGRDHFAVFTPYFRRWSEAHRRTPLSPPRSLSMPSIHSDPLPQPADLSSGRPSPQLRVGGESTGRALLRDWLDGPITGYAHDNDDLAADATSRLSPYIHFGCVSPTEVVRRVDTSTDGGLAFARQLAWRDFHHQVLAARPDAAWSDYRTRVTAGPDDEQAVTAWRDGRTGYPIVDAGMRQLRAEGWMPGRARLIAASFLAKSLHQDWRVGAAHFLRWLVDADLANNQLNWQWVAGTGTDTRPNRVLNPLRQADRYDPDGVYVRRWLPELAHLPGASIHRPWRATVDPAQYPAPLIDCVGS